jgi:hypothetical protein
MPQADAALLSEMRTTNQALRAGRPAPNNTLAAAMGPIPESMTAYRSVPRSEFGNVAPEDLRGFVVRDAGFFPASSAPTTPQPGEVRMTIDIPEGTNAAASPDTHEVVVDAGAEMSVDEVTTNPDGSTNMHLSVLPDSTDEPGPDTSSPDTPAPDVAEPSAEPAAEAGADFAQRLDTAATGTDAREAAPASLERDSDPPLTTEQSEALDDYRADNYQPINRLLRGGDPAEGNVYADRETTQGWIDDIDSAMDQSRLTTEVQAWRGLDGGVIFGRRMSGDLTGMEWREDAYVSTSTDPNVSEDFATNGGVNDNPVMMRVVIPAGVGAVELSGQSGALPESELMLQRGLTMRVVADNGVDENGIRQIDVEVVPIDATTSA